MLLSVGTAAVPKLPRVLLHQSEHEAFGAVGAHQFWCATPSPWRPKPSVKSSMVPYLGQKLRLTPAKENTFPTFCSTRLASTSCSKRKVHHVEVFAAPVRSRKAPRGTKLSCNGGRHIRYETRPHDQPPAPSHWSEMN